MAKKTKHLPVKATVPFKKGLIRTKDGGNKQRLDVAPVQCVQVVVPVFVFYPKYQRRVYDVEKIGGVSRCVRWKIAYDIGAAILSKILIAGGREKSNDYTHLRSLLP